jgi:hypothetical protein
MGMKCLVGIDCLGSLIRASTSYFFSLSEKRYWLIIGKVIFNVS